MPQSPFRSIAITGGLLLLVIFGSWYFLTRPLWQRYAGERANLSAASVQNQQLTSALALLQNFLDDYTAQQKNTTLVNAALPAKSVDTANLSNEIGLMAQASGIVLSNLSLDEGNNDKATVENAIQPVTVTLTAQGTYPSLKDFVLRLEQNLRLMDVSHLTLKADQNNQLQYQIILQTYYQK